eukprot:13296921-Alexandrium_andersonii.AAC.1
MSASLVGSEMCIRDRLMPAHACSCLLMPVAGLPATSPANSVAPADIAVSYTHLTLPTICSV